MMAASLGSKPPEPKALLRGHRAAISCVTFLFGGTEFLASGDVDGDLLLWSLSTKRVVKPELEAHPGGVLTLVACDRDKRWISQGRTDGNIKVWNDTELIDVVRTESESFCRASVIWGDTSLDDVFIACTTREDSVIAVWRANDSAGRRLLKPPEDVKWGMAMDVLLRAISDRRYALVVYEDGYLRVFDVDNAVLLHNMVVQVQPTNEPVTSLILGPVSASNVAQGLAGGASNELGLFEVNFAEESATFKSFVSAVEKSALETKSSQEDEDSARLGKGVGQLALRPDGRICAIASWDKRLRIIHFRTSKHLAVLKHHRGSVQAVCFAADSSLLASGSKDQNIAIWSIYNDK